MLNRSPNTSVGKFCAKDANDSTLTTDTDSMQGVVFSVDGMGQLIWWLDQLRSFIPLATMMRPAAIDLLRINMHEYAVQVSRTG